MNIGDWSGNQWMNVFSTEAEKILGVSSQEVGEARENNEDGKLLQEANFREFIFKCRTKLETYNVIPIKYVVFGRKHNSFLF